MRRIAIALTATGLVFAQTSAPSHSLKFEVATLKPNTTGDNRGIIKPAQGGQRYEATNLAARFYIMTAYRLKGEQIVGGPAWIDSDRFDMQGKAEKPSTNDELHEMLKSLLEERFQLKFHWDNKEMPIYALTVDKGGPKIEQHQATNAGDPWIDQSIDGAIHVKMTGTFAPMDYFVWRLGQLMDRPVVDMTKLKGGYDFTLTYTRELPPGIQEGASFNGQPIDTSGPSIFQAVQKQMGLKLEAQKGMAPVMVIDRMEKPTATDN